MATIVGQLDAVEQLDRMLDDGSRDPFRPEEEVAPLQLEAARERFAQQRGRIRVLDARATDTGVDEIRTLADLVPLLFSHTTYKSYPETFIRKGRWAAMLTWLGTVSAYPLDDVDISNVNDIDDWIAALWKADHPVYVSSGTSGKVSILPMSQLDRKNIGRFIGRVLAWPDTVPQRNDYRFYQLGPAKGPNRQIDNFTMLVERFADPSKVRVISDEPLKISAISRAAELRQKMMEGTATPGEIEAFELEAVERSAPMLGALRDMAHEIVEQRHEKMMVYGFWSQHWQILEEARKTGVGDGEFHPDTVIGAGGGAKGFAMPDDFADQILRFYGDVRRHRGYSMTEMTQVFYQCPEGRYHRPAGIIPLVLDSTGERLAERDGDMVEGRFGYMDLNVEGRWGGLITGDKVQMDYGATCPCGRPGPTILDTIVRYKDLGDEDKITCAGTFDAYVRGTLAQ
jgi:hypothetical protein